MMADPRPSASRIPAALVLLASVVLSGLTADAVRAQGPQVAKLQQWGRNLDVDDRVLDELGRFGSEEAPVLSTEYRAVLAARLRAELFGAAARVLSGLSSSRCEPFVSVSFPATRENWELKDWALEDLKLQDSKEEAGNLQGGDAEERKDFEESLIRTESLSCIETTADDPSSALTIYTSLEFRRAAESRIEAIRTEESETCVRTGGVFGLLDATSSCSRTERLDLDSLATHHSQVVANPDPDDTQIVYFKESLKTVKRIPGGVAVHHVHYSRSVGLGRLERWVGEKKVRESEEDTLALLRERIIATE